MTVCTGSPGQGFSIIALTGPRQAGKTTLAKAVFSQDKPYVSLENPDEREFAEQNPLGFLQRFPSGAILDEVQRCPGLLSWLQGIVDERGRMGDFILTDSAQFEPDSSVTQSLAGRIGPETSGNPARSVIDRLRRWCRQFSWRN